MKYILHWRYGTNHIFEESDLGTAFNEASKGGETRQWDLSAWETWHAEYVNKKEEPCSKKK